MIFWPQDLYKICAKLIPLHCGLNTRLIWIFVSDFLFQKIKLLGGYWEFRIYWLYNLQKDEPFKKDVLGMA